MNSAIGNFDNSGVNLSEHRHSEIDWCKSKIVSLEDEIARLRNTLAFREITTPVENKLLNDLLFLDVSTDDWEKFTQLAYFMLANGATLYELQQRIMGFS